VQLLLIRIEEPACNSSSTHHYLHGFGLVIGWVFLIECQMCLVICFVLVWKTPSCADQVADGRTKSVRWWHSGLWAVSCGCCSGRKSKSYRSIF